MTETDDYHLIRVSLNWREPIIIDTSGTVPHVWADPSIPQREIDAAVRAALIPKLTDRDRAKHHRPSRPVDRSLWRMARRLCGPSTADLFDLDFLATADKNMIMDTIVEAAISDTDADMVGLQVFDPFWGRLEITASEGFSPEYVDNFRFVYASDPTPCAAALTTRQPVLVPDLTRSPILVGQPSLDVFLGAGSRAMASYPLRDGDRVLGVLNFHFRRTGVMRGAHDLVAQAAAMALSRC